MTILSPVFSLVLHPALTSSFYCPLFFDFPSPFFIYSIFFPLFLNLSHLPALWLPFICQPHLCQTHNFSILLVSCLSCSLFISRKQFLPSKFFFFFCILLFIQLSVSSPTLVSLLLSVVVCISWPQLLWILGSNRQCTVVVSDVCVTCFSPDPMSSS